MTEPAPATAPPADHGLGHDLGIGDSLGPVEGFLDRFIHPHHHDDIPASPPIPPSAAAPETITTPEEPMPRLADLATHVNALTGNKLIAALDAEDLGATLTDDQVAGVIGVVRLFTAGQSA